MDDVDFAALWNIEERGEGFGLSDVAGENLAIQPGESVGMVWRRNEGADLCGWFGAVELTDDVVAEKTVGAGDDVGF